MAWVSLVIDSRFSAVNPYSSRVCSTGPEGYVPFFEEKPWVITGRDLNVVRDARGARVPGYWPLADLSLILRVTRAVVEPIDGTTFELMGNNGP